ncbi:hypothetical protein [Saccharothrix xinjiangensis]|uniref:Tetratricopeptide repeat protein n=1 Tax=Saccharothrix xinjiangensis TaxID=204798 RepID=A0ABV9XSR7_9PSEU
MSADELLRRLDELGAELKVRDRPERRAWNRLEPTRSGWTRRLYDDQAFLLWKDVLRRFPDDLRTVHHLAIMHHARAIDAEQSAHPRKSDADWREALAHWHRLFEAEEFWAGLADRAEVAPALVAEVRQDLAERLLRIHFDIALDEGSPHHRARFHVELALGSPFPGDLVERVRVKAYERAVEGLDASVWGPTSFDQELLRTAVDTVTRHLDRDRGCVAALTDLLKLLVQVQGDQVRQANGTVGRDETDRALDAVRATARKYDGHVSRLEPQLLGVTERDPLVLSDLALWHSRAGQACVARHAYEEAAGFYRRGLRAARAGEDPHVGELRDGWLLATVLAAREHAADDRERARRLLSSIKDVERPPGVVLLVRAQARLRLGDLDEAERDADDARAAIESSPDDAHVRWGEDAEGLRVACAQLVAHIHQARRAEDIAPHLKMAEEAMASARWSEAAARLDAALEVDGDFVPALVRRAECRLGQYEVDAAGADLDRAERLVRSSGGDERALEAVRELRKVLAGLREQVTACGGPGAARLHQEGIKAFNAGRHDEAIRLLRSARAAARPRSTKKLDRELATCLNAVACELVKPVTDDLVSRGPANSSYLALDESVRHLLRSRGLPVDLPGLGGPSLGDRPLNALARVLRAEQMLNEAMKLHANRVVVANLEQVRLLRRRVEGTW